MLWYSTRTTIGIDVSDHIIRAVEVVHARKRWVVSKFNEAAVPVGAVVQGEIRNPEQLLSALQTLLKHRFETRHAAAVVSLPESHAFLKTILLKNSDVLENEIPKHLPFPIHDVTVDSLSHGMIERDGQSERIVSFAAIPNRVAEQYAAVMQQAHIHCRALEVESQALARLSVQQSRSSGVSVLVDLGKNHATVVVIANGRIDVTHSSLDITADSHGKLGNEILRVIRFHREHGPLVDHTNQYTVLLTGGGSRIPGLVDDLAKEMQLPVSVATLPEHSVIPEELQKTVYSYNTAIGLGMREYFPL